MKIFLTGGTGFIGSQLRHRLAERGHSVMLASRRPPVDRRERETWTYFDLAAPPLREQIASLLNDVDAVVNAAGIFRETREGPSFRALHDEGPQALFAACLERHVARIVQVSALGADDEAASAFHRSKRAADEFLLSLPLRGVVVQPSLVFGVGGASAELFTRLAALPVVPLPAGGVQQVQPVHVDDVTAALVTLVEGATTTGRIAFVGPRPLLLREYLATLRRSLGLGPARFVSVPGAVMTRAARLGDHVEQAPLDSETWQMLQRGNTGPPDAIASLLGRSPRDAAEFIEPAEAPLLRRSAQLAWLAPLLRLSVAAVWLVTGVVSLGIYPVEESYGLLARAGVAEALRPAALYGAALLDLALGVATLAVRGRSWVWLAQIALILAYTAIISVRLPEFWLHAYGPVLKNLPMLAVLVMLYVIERRPRERTVAYEIGKWMHILSSTVLFGTGLGSAYYMFFASLTRDPRTICNVVRLVVIADWVFTATTIIFQPLSGFYLVHLAGFPLTSRWIVWTMVLYVVAGACWIPVVFLQMRMRRLAQAAAAAGSALPAAYDRLLRWWVALGIPAFVSLVIVLYLMVAKPA